MGKREITGHNHLCENHIVPCPLIKIWRGSEVDSEREIYRKRFRISLKWNQRKSRTINMPYTPSYYMWKLPYSWGFFGSIIQVYWGLFFSSISTEENLWFNLCPCLCNIQVGYNAGNRIPDFPRKITSSLGVWNCWVQILAIHNLGAGWMLSLGRALACSSCQSGPKHLVAPSGIYLNLQIPSFP